MADSFTFNQVQGRFGEFVPNLDAATVVTFTINNAQGQLGEIAPVLDEAGAAPGGVEAVAVGMNLGSQPIGIRWQTVAY